jgi:hypothetical protein
LLFAGILTLIIFELLGTLKISGLIDWYWVFVIIPLEISLFMFSYIQFKRAKILIARNTTNRYSYYGLLGMQFLTQKTVVGLVSLTALVELYPFLGFEADIAAYTIVILAVLWIIVVMSYRSEIDEYSAWLAARLAQNILLCSFFFVNLMVTLKPSPEGETKPYPPNYLVIVMPLLANFALNALIEWARGVFVGGSKGSRSNRAIVINILLVIATVYVYLMLEEVVPTIFNLEYLLMYMIAIELYFFMLGLEFNDASY